MFHLAKAPHLQYLRQEPEEIMAQFAMFHRDLINIPGRHSICRVATNKKEKCPKLMVKPYANSHLTRILGNPIKKTAEKATRANLRPAKRKGGMPLSPIFMTTKFNPHIITTQRASNISFTDIDLFPLINDCKKPGSPAPENSFHRG